MSERLVFLSGPVTGNAYDSTLSWREEVAKALPSDIVAVSPMRGKDYLKEETQVADAYEEYPLSSAAGITCRDHNDVKRCDMLFVNFLGAEKVSIGSVMEIAWAHAYQKPIVIVAEEDNINMHAFVRQVAAFKVRTIEEGINVTRHVLSNEV